MIEMNKFRKQTRYLIQDLYAGSFAAMPFLKFSEDHVCSSSRSHGRRRRKQNMRRMKAKFSTMVEDPEQSSTSTSLPSTSTLAKRSKTTGNKKSGSNESTLSMISSPWSTESSVTTRCRGYDSLNWRVFTSSTTTAEPGATATCYGSSTNGLSAFISKESSNTFSDKERPVKVKFSHIESPEGPKSPLSTNSLSSLWTLEGFASTAQFSDETVKVKYPWSPSTNDQIDLSIEYPSSFSLTTQKCSLETIKGKDSIMDYSPMNYLPCSGDIHPNHDWTLVKEKGISFCPV